MAFVSCKIKKNKTYTQVKDEKINESGKNSILSTKTLKLKSNLKEKNAAKSRKIQNFTK